MKNNNSMHFICYTWDDSIIFSMERLNIYKYLFTNDLIFLMQRFCPLQGEIVQPWPQFSLHLCSWVQWRYHSLQTQQSD